MKQPGNSQSVEDLAKIQEESEKQQRPDQKTVTSVSSKIRQRLHNLPDPTNPPLGYDEHKAFDKVFPYINIPALHPKNHGDTVIFNDTDSPANKVYLGDNLEVLRTLKSESIDLIYIDPPFFSGRNYNVIWGDTNEVRTFGDIWEGGITSYLIWLNARLWEMRRVLKKTGSIYVHCDWHASHYIKTEMDKIFGYDSFRTELIWSYRKWGNGNRGFLRNNDSIFYYAKSSGHIFNKQYVELSARTLHDYKGIKLKDFVTEDGTVVKRQTEKESEGAPMPSVWQIGYIHGSAKEKIGYPTQKPEELLERIIKASSNEGDVVADFFCGGGTTLAVAQRLGRKFLGCDSSRVAVSVTLDRLVKLGEKMSGIESNISAKEEAFQMGLQTEGITEKVPNITVNYLGVYPVEKFAHLDHEEFINFVLTAYGASRNTGESFIHGFKPPAQQEPLLIGLADPNESIDPKDIQKFFDAIKNKLEPNKMVQAKIVAWRFSREVLKYIDVLKKYSEKNNLPLDLEAIPLDSKEFRKRILQRMPGVEEAELFLRFSKHPCIGALKAKRTGKLEYEFEAVDAISTNENGWLVNCQWDFDYQEGHFAADKDYILSREKKRDPKRGEIFGAVLAAKYKFEKSGEYTVACRIQDNLAGETVMDMKVVVS